MANTHKCAGLQGDCWFCKPNTTRKTENSKTRPYGKKHTKRWLAGRLLVLQTEYNSQDRKQQNPPIWQKAHKALVRREIAGFANRIQLARPKTAKPAHTAGIKK
ncbi:MAG: hypothetical protein IKK27_04700 [Alistipes sp.]|nr:hypothetical protein [Rikenellaceae bacterium]MBR3793219.1 hypothetical protein [Alistipes sp.]